jgi:hypothetical protein
MRRGAPVRSLSEEEKSALGAWGSLPLLVRGEVERVRNEASEGEVQRATDHRRLLAGVDIEG